MTSAATAPRATDLGRARVWHLVTFLVSLGSMTVQIVLTIRGVNVLTDSDTGVQTTTVSTALLRFFSYFTIQSNIAVSWVSLLLALDPARDGRGLRVLRIAALFGITLTLIVYLVALLPILDLSGTAWWTDKGLHVVTPVLVIAGWFRYGPRPRITGRDLGLALIWPFAYFVYSLVHGAITDWYPYPFVDVVKIGYPRALVNLAVVILVLLAIGAAYLRLDRVLTQRSERSERSEP